MGDRERTLEDLVTRDSARRTLAELLESHFAGRSVLVTGHSGFVGHWLTTWLSSVGSEVLGVSLPPVFDRARTDLRPAPTVRSARADIRSRPAVDSIFDEFKPEIVFHLAAQALVLPSYEDPIGTFETNVLGTANVLDAVRRAGSVDACVVVTSDKCYATQDGAHKEEDPLGGDDPYSASKAAAEIVAHAFFSSYFDDLGIAMATARAGNILGGGDDAPQRILPDCVRSFRSASPLELRHPDAIRPWQHVLDAVAGYLRLGSDLLEGSGSYAGPWNFGPSAADATSVGELVGHFADAWRRLGGNTSDVVRVANAPADERLTLLLDSSKARSNLGWRHFLGLEKTVEWTAEWYYTVVEKGRDGASATTEQIDRYLQLEEESYENESPCLRVQ